MRHSSNAPTVRIGDKTHQLSVHRGSGQFAKQFRNRRYYFGPLSDPDGAKKRFAREWPLIISGQDVARRVLPASVDYLSIGDLCNAFLHDRRIKVDSRELSLRTWNDYRVTCQRLIEFFGRDRSVTDLKPADFTNLRGHLAKGVSGQPVALSTLAGRVVESRLVFGFAHASDLIQHPLKFGPGFSRPDARHLAIERANQGVRLFTPQQFQALLDVADWQMRAFLLLGANAALGPADLGRLTVDHIDLKRQWLDFPRPKSGAQRKCPLWNETVSSLSEALTRRRHPADPKYEKLVFLTKRGQPWHRENLGSYGGPLSSEFTKLRKRHNVEAPNFYRLRHTFEVVAGETLDQPSVDLIMGHRPFTSDMGAHYGNGQISDERLQAVATHVHRWLIGTGGDV